MVKKLKAGIRAQGGCKASEKKIYFLSTYYPSAKRRRNKCWVEQVNLNHSPVYMRKNPSVYQQQY
jgi:hypothetical protein